MKYSEDDISYIQAHYNVDMTSEQIAAHFGTNDKAIRNAVLRFRERGIEFKQKKALIGEVRIVQHRTDGTKCYRKKTAAGWEFAGTIGVRQRKSRHDLNPIKQVKATKATTASKPVKTQKADPVLKSSSGRALLFRTDINPEVVNIRKEKEECRMVRIDARTWKPVPISKLQNYSPMVADIKIGVYALPGVEIELVKPEDIIAIVCEYYAMPRDLLNDHDRHRPLVKCRAISWYLMRRHLNKKKYSLKKIAQHFIGFDHTTVIHNITSLSNDMRTDGVLKKEVESIELLIKERLLL